jgi:predicted RNase H-like nuclease (RuvC/YqgF family)
VSSGATPIIDLSNLDKKNIKPEMVIDLGKRVTSLTEQNAHLQNYILELVKENEVLQGKLRDMKVTIDENKKML